MSKQIKLAAQTRSVAGRTSVKKLRAAGKVPAVIYGATTASANLQVGAREINEVLSHATGEQMLVELEIHDGNKTTNTLALIQEVQHHPVRSIVLHVDFHAVSADEKLHAHVTVEVVGEAVGVKTYGGRLELMLHDIEVECLPKDLPEIIKLNVAQLNVGDAIHLRDVELPAGVTFRGDGDLTVLRVAASTTGTEEVAADGPSQPEVIREKKVADAEKK